MITKRKKIWIILQDDVANSQESQESNPEELVATDVHVPVCIFRYRIEMIYI